MSSRKEKGGWKDKRKRCLELGWAGSYTLILRNVCRNCQSFFLRLMTWWVRYTAVWWGWLMARRSNAAIVRCVCACVCCCLIASQVALQAKCHWRPVCFLFFFHASSSSVLATLPLSLFSARVLAWLGMNKLISFFWGFVLVWQAVQMFESQKSGH